MCSVQKIEVLQKEYYLQVSQGVGLTASESYESYSVVVSGRVQRDLLAKHYVPTASLKANRTGRAGDWYATPNLCGKYDPPIPCIGSNEVLRSGNRYPVT